MLLVSECTGLDPSWMHLTTTATFPLVTGTTVDVTCHTRIYRNTGDSTVTCDQDTRYRYGDEPECQEIGQQSAIYTAII